MGKFIGWGGKESFVESVRFCLFHYEGRSRNLISASSPKSRINESLSRPDPRSLFQQGWPLPSLSFIRTPPKPSISLWILTWPLSTARIPHFPAADQHFPAVAPLLLPGDSASKEFLSWNSFPLQFLSWNSFPPPISCAGRSGQICADFCTSSLTPCWGRIKYWSYFCCEAWRTKMLSAV